MIQEDAASASEDVTHEIDDEENEQPSESAPANSSKRQMTGKGKKAKKRMSPLAIRTKELSAKYAKTFVNHSQGVTKGEESRIKKNAKERLRRHQKKQLALQNSETCDPPIFSCSSTE
jgi:hypothetical protein